jgi:transposase
MATPARHVTLTPEQDQTLRTLEHAPRIHTKVRLRASIVRLNAAGWTVPSVAEHHKRNQQSVHNDLDRFEQHGIQGLTDGKSTGKPGKFTPKIEAFLKMLLEQDRAWNSKQLGEEINQKFRVKLEREAIRVKLLELGFSWKRARYSPGKTPDAQTVSEFKADLDTLKRGRWTRN